MARRKRLSDQEARDRTMAALDRWAERLTRTEAGTVALLGGGVAALGGLGGLALSQGWPVPEWVTHPGRTVLRQIAAALPRGHGIPWIPGI